MNSKSSDQTKRLPKRERLRRSYFIRLHEDFLDKLRTDPGHGVSRGEDLHEEHEFKYTLTCKGKYGRPDATFDCGYITVDSGGCSLYGYHHGHGHNVYIKPEDIKEIR